MRFILQSWYGLLPAPWAHVAIALVSLLCGTIVGLEREKREKPAGLRTITLIAFGSTAFTMGGMLFSASDPSRVAAQLVTGIGFLGAGVILHRSDRVVSGITTAATIWAIAAIGMVAGVGYPVGAFAAAAVLYVVLVLGERVETKFNGPCRHVRCVVTFAHDAGKARPQIEGLLDEHEVPLGERRFARLADGSETAEITYCAEHRHHREVLTKLAEHPLVLSMEVGSAPLR